MKKTVLIYSSMSDLTPLLDEQTIFVNYYNLEDAWRFCQANKETRKIIFILPNQLDRMNETIDKIILIQEKDFIRQKPLFIDLKLDINEIFFAVDVESEIPEKLKSFETIIL